MGEGTFLVGAAIVSGTILLMVKMIAGAFARGKGSSSELQERLDFTERMLTQARSREALPPGEPGG